MSIRTSFNPMGTLGALEYLDGLALERSFEIQELDGLTINDSPQLKVVVRFRYDRNPLPDSEKFIWLYRISQTNEGRLLFYRNEYAYNWIVENNTSQYGSGVGFLELNVNTEYALEVDRSGAALNGVFYPSGGVDAYTADGSPLKLSLAYKGVTFRTVELYKNGTLLLRLKPAMQQGLTGFYDTVSKTFFEA